MECFQKVSAAIGPVYRRLTSRNGADGGSAYLDLEDVADLRAGSPFFGADLGRGRPLQGRHQGLPRLIL